MGNHEGYTFEKTRRGHPQMGLMRTEPRRVHRDCAPQEGRYDPHQGQRERQRRQMRREQQLADA